jgi:isopentenyldiphosphate isomerase
MGEVELFDVVDADDRPIDKAERAEVHGRGLRHRAVHVLVSDPSGMIYLQRRAAHKDCAPGLWDTSAAGHLASGEDYDNAAHRELREELGVDGAGQLRRLFKIDACTETGNEFVWVYACVTEAVIVPDPAEIAEGRWIARADLDQWIAREPESFTDTFRIIWRRLLPGTGTIET